MNAMEEQYADLTPKCGHTDGSKHDCVYVEQRNRQIAAAVRFANEVVRDDDGAKWNGAFHTEMNRLMRQNVVLAIVPEVDSEVEPEVEVNTNKKEQ